MASKRLRANDKDGKQKAEGQNDKDGEQKENMQTTRAMLADRQYKA